MKKNTLLVLALFMSIMLSAQSVVINRPYPGGTLLVSTVFNDDNGAWVGDFFEIDETIAIGQLSFDGLNSGGANLGDILTGFNIIIYENVDGLPTGDPTMIGAGLHEIRNIDLANIVTTEFGTARSNFLVNVTDANDGVQVILEPGSYWITGYPSVNVGTDPDATRWWNWGFSKRYSRRSSFIY